MMPNIDLLSLLDARRPLHSLPQPFYNDPDIYQSDLVHIWYREWIFAAASAELPKSGSYVTVQLGDYSVIIVRGADKIIRAFHNSCRHRGSRICTAHSGTAPKLVCPYHQWTYELDGRLLWARDMGPDFNPTDHGLGAVHCREIQGMVYICLADQAPDTSLLEAKAAEYMAPHDTANLKVAHQSRIVEQGNWKLVMENNRECYHCGGSHPSLCRTYSEDPEMTVMEGPHSASDVILEHWDRCDAARLPARFVSAPDLQWRMARVPLMDHQESFTMSGKAAVARRMGTIPWNDAGSLMFYHFPTSWNHLLPDHAILFRILPISPTETEVTTKWLVHRDAEEGKDYDLTKLTEVWLATNDEDRQVVEENQAGILSPAYEPGPYSPRQEMGVLHLIDWYCGVMSSRLALQAAAE